MDILHNQAVHASSAFALTQAQNFLPWETGSHERIMVIAPHPDDEVLAAGGVIATAMNLRNQIRVIIATNGDASYATALAHGSHLFTRKNFQHQAVMRQRESLNALASLGVSAEQIRFWGFPDRGLTALWQKHWDTQNPYHSFTTGYSHSLQALNSAVLPFTGSSLQALMKKEFLEFSPTTVIMPHPHDHHADHSALAGITLLAAKQYYAEASLATPTLLAYWMWEQLKPWLTGAPARDLASISFEADSARMADRRLTLSPEIHDQKTRALQCFPSQNISAGKIFRRVLQSPHEIFALLQPAL